MYLAISLVAFGLLVLGHEFGHFIMAKANGVKVLEFSIGMGPRLLKWQGKETMYSLKALPIGGSVRMYGETEEEVGDDSFLSKSPLRKISIIVAGPLMNIIMAILILFVITINLGYADTTVREVIAGSPAEAAGLASGDRIVEINGQNTYTFEDVTTYIAFNGQKELAVRVVSGGQEKLVTIVPQTSEDGRTIIGVAPNVYENPGLFQAIGQSFKKGLSLINQTIFSLKVLFTGQASLNDLGGPVTIFKVSSEVAKISFWNLASFIAFLSVNLAVLNLIPFPALDGGWILILLVELFTKRKLPEKFVGIWNTIGFVVLMSFMALVTFKDIFFPINL